MKPVFYFSKTLRRFFLKLRMLACSPNLRKVVLLIVMAASSLFNARPAESQSGIEVENAAAPYQFGEQITFVATLKASIPIQSAAIVISDQAQSLNRVEAVIVQPDG